MLLTRIDGGGTNLQLPFSLFSGAAEEALSYEELAAKVRSRIQEKVEPS